MPTEKLSNNHGNFIDLTKSQELSGLFKRLWTGASLHRTYDEDQSIGIVIVMKIQVIFIVNLMEGE